MSIQPPTIPGYREAVLKEWILRESSFVLTTEWLGPFEVKPMSLRHYSILRLIGSPLLTGETPALTELVAFLWVVSVENDGGKPTNKFFKRCQNIFPRKWAIRKSIITAAEVITKARQYILDATQDFPESSGNRNEKSFFSDVAWICHVFAFNYGWDDEKTLDTPLIRLMQYYRCIRSDKGNRIMFNPSDKVVGEWLSNQNRKN